MKRKSWLNKKDYLYWCKYLVYNEKQIDTYNGKEILVDKNQRKGYTVSSKISNIKVNITKNNKVCPSIFYYD